ncbi:hypothetical protein [Alienimonas californiensis]|uniref:hypothetical protein n=1 Tax=Alienimonas californiensis TaxID=2527989 RepID=UPI0011A0410E|nr:hypothetical protein [Alienimonas californiensis]
MDERADTVTAATGQDAANAAVQHNKQEIESEGADPANPEIGTTLIQFPSGLGVVATGVGTYRTMPNATATRLSQRNAAVVAFAMAKKNLAAYLGGLSNESKEELRESLEDIQRADGGVTNFETSTDISLSQSVDMMLRGFITYEVQNRPEEGLYYVSIITTPKTRGQFERPSSGQVDATSLRDGLQKVLTEVKSGLVPPVGGRIVTVPSTGEVAFIGFGSSVVRDSRSPAMTARMKLTAQKVARAYAQDALCGLIIGDKTAWEGQVLESYSDQYQEFEAATENDPLAPDAAGEQKLDAARESFLATMKVTDTYRGARSGALPPGIDVKSWFDEDGAWAYGMAVYLPGVSDAAAGIGRQMRDARILGRPAGGDSGGAAEGPPVRPLPSGRVGGDDL